jgi:hypothetical protein
MGGSSEAGAAPGGAGGDGGTDCEALGCEFSGDGLCDSRGLVTWVCFGAFDYQAFMDAGCEDAGSQVPRMCCPPDFMTECQTPPP